MSTTFPEDLKHPDKIVAAWDTLASGGTNNGILVGAGREVLWQVLDDVRHSLRLAVNGAEITEEAAGEIIDTVDDYLSNYYGDE